MPVWKVEQPESGARNGSSLEIVYGCMRGDGASILNEYTDNAYYEGKGYFQLDSSRVVPGVGFDKVYLTFTREKNSDASGGSGDHDTEGVTEYNATTATMEKPIESLKNYKTHWNYDLYEYVKNGELPLGFAPEWYFDATNRIIPSTDFGKYQWAQNQPAPDAEGSWSLVAARTKQAEAYLYPAPVISETIYFHSREKAFARLTAVGKLKAPGYTGPYDSSSECWLVTNSTVQKIGRYWAVVTEYTYADNGWDINLYQEENEEE